MEEEETIVLKPVSKKVGAIIKRYEKDFWSKEGRNKTDEANQQYWYQIQYYVNKIEKHKLLTFENGVGLQLLNLYLVHELPKYGVSNYLKLMEKLWQRY